MPLPRRRVDRIQIGQLQTGQEVFLDIGHSGLDPPLFVRPARSARLDREAVVLGKVQVAGVEDRRLADQMGLDGGAAIIDHNLARNRMQVLEGMLVAGQKVLLVAADTFRAAASEQLQRWAERVGAGCVHHQSGADPSAVAFDGIKAAVARGVDVVIVDTAGRLHVKSHLIEELKKIEAAVAKP